jgi:hypothetical protein
MHDAATEATRDPTARTALAERLEGVLARKDGQPCHRPADAAPR